MTGEIIDCELRTRRLKENQLVENSDVSNLACLKLWFFLIKKLKKGIQSLKLQLSVRLSFSIISKEIRIGLQVHIYVLNPYYYSTLTTNNTFQQQFKFGLYQSLVQICWGCISSSICELNLELMWYNYVQACEDDHGEMFFGFSVLFANLDFLDEAINISLL